MEEGREGDDTGVLFGPFLERISFVDREREGNDTGALFSPLAHNSSHSFLERRPRLMSPFLAHPPGGNEPLRGTQPHPAIQHCFTRPELRA